MMCAFFVTAKSIANRSERLVPKPPIESNANESILSAISIGICICCTIFSLRKGRHDVPHRRLDSLI